MCVFLFNFAKENIIYEVTAELFCVSEQYSDV